MSAMIETKDADGRVMQVGADVRLRLSRLDVHGVDESERNGIVQSISHDGKYVSVDLDSGDVGTFGVEEIRVNAVENDDDGDEPTGPVATDADGTELFIGDNVRVRLSKLAKHNIARAERHGYLFTVSPSGRLGVHFGNNTEGLFETNDIRRD